jgi:hypothetical protein
MPHCGKNLVPRPGKLKRSCKTDSRATAGHNNSAHDSKVAQRDELSAQDVRFTSLTVAISETAFTDQNGEDSCGFGTHRQCLAAKRKNGSLHALPLLKGGHNSQVYWSNNAGESVGFLKPVYPIRTARFLPSSSDLRR